MTTDSSSGSTTERDQVVSEFLAVIGMARLVGHPNAVYWNQRFASTVQVRTTAWLRGATRNVRRQVDTWLEGQKHDAS